MKKHLLKITVSILLIMALSLGAAILCCADNSNPDFIMEGDELNIKASDILAVEGSFTYDESQFQRGAILIDSNLSDDPDVNGQIFLHGGKGDTFTFTVDFGKQKVNSMSYSGYGLASAPTVIALYDGDKQLGTGTINGGNGWIDNDKAGWQNGTMELSETLSGVKTLTLKVIDSAPAWPADAFGNIVFHYSGNEGPDFVLEGDGYIIKGKDLLELNGCFSDKERTYNADGHGIAATPYNPEASEAVNGAMIHNSGKGDTFTFTADFGETPYEKIDVSSYGICENSVLEFIIDGESCGIVFATGDNGWADYDMNVWNHDVLTLEKGLTGIHTVTIKVVESQDSWPAAVFGNFCFMYGEQQTVPDTDTDTDADTDIDTESQSEPQTEPENPVTGDGAVKICFAAAVISVIISAAYISIRRDKKRTK